MAQWIERVASDHEVGGSNPSGRAKFRGSAFAKQMRVLSLEARHVGKLAQLVERWFVEPAVTGSSPVLPPIVSLIVSLALGSFTFKANFRVRKMLY